MADRAPTLLEALLALAEVVRRYVDLDDEHQRRIDTTGMKEALAALPVSSPCPPTGDGGQK